MGRGCTDSATGSCDERCILWGAAQTAGTPCLAAMKSTRAPLTCNVLDPPPRLNFTLLCRRQRTQHAVLRSGDQKAGTCCGAQQRGRAI